MPSALCLIMIVPPNPKFLNHWGKHKYTVLYYVIIHAVQIKTKLLLSYVAKAFQFGISIYPYLWFEEQFITICLIPQAAILLREWMKMRSTVAWCGLACRTTLLCMGQRWMGLTLPSISLRMLIWRPSWSLRPARKWHQSGNTIRCTGMHILT